MSTRKKRFENLQFFLVGFLLIVNGTIGTDFPLISYALLFGGILFLIYAVYCILKKKNNERLKFFALFCESFALFAAAFILFYSGSKYLPYLYLLAGTGLLIAIYVKYRKIEKTKLSKN